MSSALDHASRSSHDELPADLPVWYSVKKTQKTYLLYYRCNVAAISWVHGLSSKVVLRDPTKHCKELRVTFMLPRNIFLTPILNLSLIQTPTLTLAVFRYSFLFFSKYGMNIKTIINTRQFFNINQICTCTHSGGRVHRTQAFRSRDECLTIEPTARARTSFFVFPCSVCDDVSPCR